MFRLSIEEVDGNVRTTSDIEHNLYYIGGRATVCRTESVGAAVNELSVLSASDKTVRQENVDD